MKKYITSFLFFSLLFGFTYSQNEVDALRYSQIVYGGTARSSAMGNAFGSLGADFSSIIINPAGIGLYKKSEMSVTPSIFVGSTKSSYLGNETNDLKYNFNINSFGSVFSFELNKGVENNVWKGFQFAFGINRLNNYNNMILIEGTNRQNSILNDFVTKADGNTPSQLNEFDTQLAFNTWLIDTLGGSTNYVSIIPKGGVIQSKSIEQKGSMNEFFLTFGGNYNDKLYMGLNLSMPYLRYFEYSTYSETNKSDSIPDFKSLTYQQNLETHGVGFYFKIGLIYRITDWVRIGGSFQSPMFFTMNDRWNTSMSSHLSFGSFDSYAPKSTTVARTNYSLNTPLRAMGSISFIILKYACISADYEYVDYRMTRLRSSTYHFVDENRNIRDEYTGQNNIRAGFEIMIDPIAIRGGYILNMNPYKSAYGDGTKNSFSGGIGFRTKSFFVDFAYIYSTSTQNYVLYNEEPSTASNNYITNNFMATVGFKF